MESCECPPRSVHTLYTSSCFPAFPSMHITNQQSEGDLSELIKSLKIHFQGGNDEVKTNKRTLRKNMNSRSTYLLFQSSSGNVSPIDAPPPTPEGFKQVTCD